MTRQTNAVTMDGSTDVLLAAAESRLRNMNKWWRRLWGWHNWLTGATVILSGLVPFGLAILHYTPPEYTRALNIALVVLTAGGFVAQVWNVTQRNRDRAQYLRGIAVDLEMAVVSFRSGLTSREEFAKKMREAYMREAQEPGA